MFTEYICMYLCMQEQCMQEEILSLKLRVSEQEEVLKGTIQRLRSTSRTKESMEHFIVSQRECLRTCVCVFVCVCERETGMWDGQVYSSLY